MRNPPTPNPGKSGQNDQRPPNQRSSGTSQVDDHVRAVDELRGVETRWREWEFELGPAAPAGRADRAALLEAATEIALAAGARPAASDSKLARTLGV